MDDWSGNEYKTFITSRRDGVFEQRKESMFPVKRLSSCDLLRGADQSEREVYFDMDATLPLHWESMVRGTLNKSSESEFEFIMETSEPALPVLSSPADELFYGGQILPLDFHSSSQMPVGEKKLLCRKLQQELAESGQNPTFVVSQRTVSEPFSKMSPGSLTRMFQPKYSKFCVNSTDVAPVETAMDSRSSSFRSQSSSMWESGDRDTGESSASRDSNGSSQDATSLSKLESTPQSADHTPTKKPSTRSTFLNQVVVNSNQDLEKAGGGTSAWMRSPFNWKGLFGSKKVLSKEKLERDDHVSALQSNVRRKLSEVSHVADNLVHATSSKIARHSCSEYSPQPPKSRHSYSEPYSQPPQCSRTNPATFMGFPSLPSTNTNGVSRSCDAGEFTPDEVPPAVSTGREWRDRGSHGLSKGRERWLKYIKFLTPPYGRSSPKASLKTDPSMATPHATTPRFPPPRAAGHASESLCPQTPPPRAKSMPAFEKTPTRRPKSLTGGLSFQALTLPPSNAKPPSTGRSRKFRSSSSSCTSSSLLPHTGNVMLASSPKTVYCSTSPKLTSKVSITSPKVKSSPKVKNHNISPRISNSNSSASELHSAVQGAIAHCKNSHSGQLSHPQLT